jgi:hypothetical protein
MALASVTYYQYIDIVFGFTPGKTRRRRFGAYNWDKSVLVVTARPFPEPNTTRVLSVTEVGSQSLSVTPGVPGDRYVTATVRNVGMDNVFIYSLTLAVIRPTIGP